MKELNILYAAFSKASKEEPGLEDEARAAFTKLEQGDEFYRKLWTAFRAATLKELMLFGFGTAALAALLYGLFLWALGLARPDQAALFATATTGATPTADDPQIHYWAAFVALVATVKLLLIGTFAAFIAAVLFRNEKGKMKNEE